MRFLSLSLCAAAAVALDISRVINVIDTHCAGEPARVVVGGILNIPGETMADKRQHMIDHEDQLRKTLMHEPRGHNDMFGAYLVAPISPGSDFGVVFMDAGGYLNMCGHDTIAAVTAVVETGMVSPSGNNQDTIVKLDTPAGLVTAKAKISGDTNRVLSVDFDNVESFLYKRDVTLNVPEVGTITFDIAFGGSFFVIIPATQVGLVISATNASKFSEIGMKIRDYVNAHIEIQHPTLPQIKQVDLVEFYGPPTAPEATLKNIVVFGEGQVDRSPCGTGTSAKMATLFAKGELAIGEKFVYESVLGTMFTGHVVEEATVGNLKAVIPNVAGNAYITGFNTLIIDPEDPLKDGFVLN